MLDLLREEFYKNMGVVLDLAVEAHELLRGDTMREIEGVKEEKEVYEHTTVTTVSILNETGEKKMGKAKGNYITIESPHLRIKNITIHKEISKILAAKLVQLIEKLQIKPDATALLVGLGNWNATPDALGPRVINSTLVTRHLHKYAPEDLQGGLRSVCALSPGVLGLSGIETAEIVKGVTEHVKPDFIIAIDALAAQNMERIGTTIQISDTGINPGSGVANRRTGINRETMGIPVIALGVPTVVNAAVIIYETFHNLFQNKPLLNKQIKQGDIQSITQKVLEPFLGDLTVTPKEIDDLIQNISKVISSGLNQGLHPEIKEEELASLLP